MFFSLQYTISKIIKIYQIIFSSRKMKETFVNNIQQLMTANQNQRIKISYLQTQKQKREQYLSGLKQSILLNKETLIVINQQGHNSDALDIASKENQHLIKLNQKLYSQNRHLNASLLLQQQLRVQEKSFYLQRVNQFQTRISDLRKYLHDKQQSFSTVVSRLKKYQQFNQKPLSQKIQDTEGLKKLTNQVIAKLLNEKNMFKHKFQQVYPNAYRFQLLNYTIKNSVNLSRFLKQINEKSQKMQNQSDGDEPRKQLIEFNLRQKQKNKINQNKKSTHTNVISNKKPNQLTKQILRLVKKQKINNQIIEGALHDAIQKNQQLLKINQNLQLAIDMLQKKMQKLIAQNYFYKNKFRAFNTGYGKKYASNTYRDDYDEPEFIDLLSLTFEIKDEQNQEVSGKVYRNLLNQSLKQDIQKMLRIPLQFSEKSSSNIVSRKQDFHQRMTQMTTNDMSRINEKLSKNINYEKQQNQRDQKSNERQKIKDKLIKCEINEQSKRFMVKSASEPRILFEWEGSPIQQQEEEEMVVDYF